jgi:hypothetical protein
MQMTDRFMPFILDRAVEMGRNVKRSSKYRSRCCSKLLYQIHGTVALARSETSNLDRMAERWPNS